MKLESRSYNNIKEHFVYIILWTVTFLAPVLSLYISSKSDSEMSFDWHHVLFVWETYIPFLILFLIHNFLLAPMLLYQRRKILYFVLTISMVILFAIFKCTIDPTNERPHHLAHQAAHFDKKNNDSFRHDMSFPREPMPPDFKREPPRHMPPNGINHRAISSVVMLILLFGMNMGVKFYVRDEDARKRMEEMEHESLQQQLAYLKYQISPHFFMNTLNNIHALVDINPEQAKSSIVVLSKMMRYLLYESNHEMIPLEREILFINNYVALMRMRFSEDKVHIRLNMPDLNDHSTICGSVPPVMFVCFVENAFKHGISYLHQTNIDISILLSEEHLTFICINTKAPEKNQEKGGVGLVNVRRRLDLIYQERYDLQTKETDDEYQVTLTLPI
jgi:hypothetical protein